MASSRAPQRPEYARGLSLCGKQQVFALARPLDGESRIAADHPALAGIVGCGDLGHVTGVKQRELQWAAVLGEGPDVGCAQRGDPVQTGGPEVGFDPRGGDHAAIADQHDAVELEALAQLLDLGGQRRRVSGIALEHLNSDGAAIGGTQQAEDDLRLVALSVAAVTVTGEFAASSFEVGRGEIVEHEAAVLEMLVRERGLDVRLRLTEPVKGGVEFVFVDVSKAEDGAEGMCGGVLAELSGGCELCRGFDDARDDHREGELGEPFGFARQQSVEAEFARHSEDGGDMPVRQRALDLEPLGGVGQTGLALQEAAQGLELVGGPMCQIGQGSGLDAVAIAVALAQEHGGR